MNSTLYAIRTPKGAVWHLIGAGEQFTICGRHSGMNPNYVATRGEPAETATCGKCKAAGTPAQVDPRRTALAELGWDAAQIDAAIAAAERVAAIDNPPAHAVGCRCMSCDAKRADSTIAELDRRQACHGNTSPCLPDVHTLAQIARDRAAADGRPCYHPRSCSRCDRLGYACGSHIVGDSGHDRCTGNGPTVPVPAELVDARIAAELDAQIGGAR